MPNIDITRPELIWPGKYDEHGNRVENRGVALPFQVIETIKEGRATREPGRTGDLFGFSGKQEGNNWHNKLIWGDNLLVLTSLLEEYAGKVDLIYIDPPFATGADFSITTSIGEGNIELTKLQSAIEAKAYRDTWGGGLGSYLEMLSSRLKIAWNLLSPDGSIYVHVDPRVSGYVRLILDEILGRDNFQNEISWCYVGGRVPKVAYGRRHDTIFFYAKSDKWTFNWQSIMKSLSKEAEDKYRYEDENGRYRLMGRCLKGSPIKAARDVSQEWEKTHPELVYRYYMKEGTLCLDYWDDIPQLNQVAKERTGFPTQKPEDLIERIVLASSKSDGLVMDFFCGSGTTAAVAEKLGRRWIACDLGRFAIHTTRKRLLEIPDCKPFELLNLGKYERTYWQGVTFGEMPQEPDQAAIAAYIGFILDLYQAQRLAGTHLHGKKGKALIHVGAVDAPVTINQVNEALAECATLGQKELHILGWEWEMGMNDPIIKHAQSEYGISLRLLNIPREVMEKRAVECGDIRFFDLAYLDAEIKPADKSGRKVQVQLKDFVIPDTDLIPDEVREKIAKWSDYIDYWAVDWDFQHDTFMNQWHTYRTRQNRKLGLISEFHDYPGPGKYHILIKVVDIFGNDTSRLLEWEAR